MDIGERDHAHPGTDPPRRGGALLFTRLRRYRNGGYPEKSASQQRQLLFLLQGKRRSAARGARLVPGEPRSYPDPGAVRENDPLERVFLLLEDYRNKILMTNYGFTCPLGRLALEIDPTRKKVHQKIAAKLQRLGHSRAQVLGRCCRWSASQDQPRSISTTSAHGDGGRRDAGPRPSRHWPL
jgi:hypothetical protein